MLARNETIFKWALYAAAAALCFFVQAFVLQRFTVWGVIPFLYPALAAIPATYEGPVPGTVFALAVGVVCDLLLPEPLPCFYTLVFPLVGLCASLIAQSWLPAGFLCSLAVTALGFVLTGVFHCFLLWTREKAAWEAGAFVCCRELLVSLPLAIPATLLFSAVHRRTHLDD
mgnify:FL=1